LRTRSPFSTRTRWLPTRDARIPRLAAQDWRNHYVPLT
jgi:hypothetical protein